MGGPLAVSIFLIVLSAAGEDHLRTVWRVCFGIGILLPVGVFFFRMRMMSSMLYRKGAIKSMYTIQEKGGILNHSGSPCAIWACI